MYIDTLNKIEKFLANVCKSTNEPITLVCEYAGHGDNGNVFNVYCKETNNESLQSLLDKNQIDEDLKLSIAQIEDALYDIVEKEAPDFEVDSGGEGTITISAKPDEPVNFNFVSFDYFSETYSKEIIDTETTITKLAESSLHNKDMAENLSTKKGTLEVSISYEGRGDNGDEFKIINKATGKSEDYLEDLVYLIVDQEHRGYEVDAGGGGEIDMKIDFDTGEISYKGIINDNIEDLTPDAHIDKPFHQYISEINERQSSHNKMRINMPKII